MDNWSKEFAGAVTICDKEGKILYMNDKATQVFSADGGEQLIGQNLFDCHTPRSRTILKDLMDNCKTNIYTIEKNGITKLIYQAPLTENGIYSGFIELSLEIPSDIPHFDRNKKDQSL